MNQIFAATLVLAACSPVLASAQNYVSDGSFENIGTGNFPAGPQGAWVVGQGQVVGQVGVYVDGSFPGSNVTDGNRALDLGLGGRPLGFSVSQELLPTIAGERYVLSFDWGAEYGLGVRAQVSVGDLTESLELPPVNPASPCSQNGLFITQSASFEFTASGNDVLLFEDMSDGTIGPCSFLAGLCVDKIVIVPLSDALVGTPVCSPGVPNSTGSSAVLETFGSTVAAQNNLTLLVSSLPRQTFVLLVAARAQGFTPNPGGSQGNLCLSGPIGRFNNDILATGRRDRVLLPLDLTQLPTPTGIINAVAGETWFFQAWHRDIVSGMQTSNFSDAREVLFQ